MKSLVNIFEDDSDITDNIVINLKNFFKGKIDSSELRYSDYFIDDVRVKYPLGETLIIFDVSDIEFLEKLNLSDDSVWLYRVFSSGYPQFEFNELSSIIEDFNYDGSYVFYEFNDENFETLEKISSYIHPTKKFKKNDREYYKSLVPKLVDIFPDKIEHLVETYWEESERAQTLSVTDLINSDLQEFVNDLGFFVYGDSIGTTVSELVMNGRYFDHNGDLKSLYDKILKKYSKKTQDFGWGDALYDTYNAKFFNKDGYNKSVNYILNDILNTIEKDGEQFEEYIKLVERISKKYELNEPHKLPKDNRYTFKIDNIDFETHKIHLLVYGPKGSFKRIVGEEEFNNFLQVGELFDLEI
jgi:hypothetical protein